MKSILIIGMGRFGHHLAKNFLEHEHDVMIVDEDEQKLCLNISGCLADHSFCSQLFHKTCDFQTTLEICANADKHHIKVPDSNTL